MWADNTVATCNSAIADRDRRAKSLGAVFPTADWEQNRDVNKGTMDRKALLRDVLRENPNDAFARYALALEYKKEELPGKARELLESLRLEQPDYLPTYYQLGKLIETAGDDEGALAIYREGLQLAILQHDLKTRSELEEAIWMLED